MIERTVSTHEFNIINKNGKEERRMDFMMFILFSIVGLVSFIAAYIFLGISLGIIYTKVI